MRRVDLMSHDDEGHDEEAEFDEPHKGKYEQSAPLPPVQRASHRHQQQQKQQQVIDLQSDGEIEEVQRTTPAAQERSRLVSSKEKSQEGGGARPLVPTKFSPVITTRSCPPSSHQSPPTIKDSPCAALNISDNSSPQSSPPAEQRQTQTEGDCVVYGESDESDCEELVIDGREALAVVVGDQKENTADASEKEETGEGRISLPLIVPSQSPHQPTQVVDFMKEEEEEEEEEAPRHSVRAREHEMDAHRETVGNKQQHKAMTSGRQEEEGVRETKRSRLETSTSKTAGRSMSVGDSKQHSITTFTATMTSNGADVPTPKKGAKSSSKGHSQNEDGVSNAARVTRNGKPFAPETVDGDASIAAEVQAIERVHATQTRSSTHKHDEKESSAEEEMEDVTPPQSQTHQQVRTASFDQFRMKEEEEEVRFQKHTHFHNNKRSSSSTPQKSPPVSTSRSTTKHDRSTSKLAVTSSDNSKKRELIEID
jgi:hypothetical protein